MAIELPPQLAGLKPAALAELDNFARMKAWLMASQIPDPEPRELARLAESAKLLPRYKQQQVEQALRRKYHERALMRFLFGGWVELDDMPERPQEPWHPEDNPLLRVWVPTFVITQDEKDPLEPHKPLPSHQYLRYMTHAWVHRPYLAVPKSRQIMVTWLFASIGAHMLIADKGKNIAGISKVEEDANRILVGRAKGILDRLPPGYPRPRHTYKYTELKVPERHNMFKAMSEEAKDLRGETWSWVFSDEAAFQAYTDEIMQAALPAVRGGGRLTLVTTSNGEESFYRTISEDGRIPVPAGQ